MMSERDCGSAWHGIIRLTSFDINIIKIKLHRKKKFVDEKHEKNTSEHGMLLENRIRSDAAEKNGCKTCGKPDDTMAG